MGRKKIRDRTKLCSALLALGIIPYSDAKKMTEDQLLSLWHFDHNILHETGHPDRDKFWNLTPMLIQPHREKTKHDAAIIAKGRRIRGKLTIGDAMAMGIRSAVLAAAKTEGQRTNPWVRKLRSRGFDKRFRKKLDGTVVKR